MPLNRKKKSESIVVFLELLDAMKHAKNFEWDAHAHADADVELVAAKKMMRDAMRRGVSVNALVRTRLPVWRKRCVVTPTPVPFHTLGWGAKTYLCDENIPTHFDGVRPWMNPKTRKELDQLPGVDERTVSLAQSVTDPGFLATIRGETSNDGRILRFAGEAGLRFVTSDVIMASRFLSMYPGLELAMPVHWGSWAVVVYKNVE